MASRVNVKFAIALAVGVILIGGAGILVAYLAINQTGDEYIARGDAALADGDLELAAQNYEDAVGHDRTRIDWLEKWRSVLVQLTPDTQAEYERSFTRHYLGILEQMAVLEWDNPERQRTLIDARYSQVYKIARGNIGAWQTIADLTKERVERLDQSDPAAKALRRYRGIAIVSQMALTDVEPVLRDEGLADLRAALEANPDDVESARAIVVWHALMWRRAYLDRRTVEARRLEQELEREVTALREAFPNEPRAAMAILEVRLDRIAAEYTDDAEQRAAMRALAGEEAPAIEAFQTADENSFDAQDLVRLNAVLARLGTPDRLEIMEEIIARIADNENVDPRLVVLRAEILGGLARYDDAIAILQDSLAQPIRPLSLEGLVQRAFRPQALRRLADQALAKWETSEEQNDKDAALAIAKDAQRQLNETTQGGQQSPEALSVAGKLAMAENRHAEAVRLFTELVEKAGQNDPDTRWRLAQSLRAANQLGASRAQLRQILDQDPSNLRAMLSLADIHARLKEEGQARAVLATVRDLYPDLPEIDQIEDRLDQLLEVNPQLEATRTRIAQARAVRSGQTPEGLARAREILTAALEDEPDSIPFTIELIDVETMSGQIAEARRLVTRALTVHPDHPQLTRLRRSLQADDPFAASLAIIEDSNMTPLQKLVRQHQFAKGQGRDGVAEDLLNRLRTDYADEPMVLDLLFGQALRDNDVDTARSLVSRAVRINADQANGLLFQARLEILENNYEAAARSLRQARDILPFDPRVLLLLGQTELRLGNVSDGLRALSSAYESRPDDANVALRYLGTLRELQRNDEALSVARAASRLNPLNLSLLNAWLELEDSTGEPEVALTERRRIHSVFPTDNKNTLALTGLLIKAEEWDEALELIGVLEDSGATVSTMLMRARLAAIRDNVDSGQKIISDFLAENEPAESNAMLQLALADFLFEFGEREKAIEVLQEARDKQSPELMEVDRQLGDYAFNSGDFETALTHYVAVHEGGADRDSRVVMRLAETYTKLERFDEADALITAIGGDATDDLTSVLIRARGLAAQGDRAGARQLFDRAVELAPNDPNPFLQRADFNSSDDSQFNDALADIEQAIRLQPDMVVARRMKAEMLATRGRASEAVAEIRRAVEADPDNDELRTLLIQLLVSVNDYPSAISVADRTVRERDDDLSWVRISGDLNARAAELAGDSPRALEHWRAAGDRYEQLYEAEANDSSRLRLANARLLQKEPDPQKALDLIDAMSAESLARGDITVLRARALHRVGRTTEALTEARSALETVDFPMQLRVWFNQVEQMLGSAAEAGRFAENLTPPVDLEASFEMQLIVSMGSDPNRQSEFLERLIALDGKLTERFELIDYYRQRGRIEFQTGSYREAEASFVKGLEYSPGDLEFNNNLAYIRSEYLGDHEGAIPPARAAATAAPQNANILDTLGWVYFKAGRMSEAQQSLQAARQYASRPLEYIPIEMHLSEVFLAKGDRPQAIRLYQSARDRLSDAPGLNSVYSENLESLRERLDQAE